MIMGSIILYVCVGLLLVMFLDNSIRENKVTHPVGTRVLLIAFWPLAVVLIVIIFLYIWDQENT